MKSGEILALEKSGLVLLFKEEAKYQFCYKE